MEIEVGEYVRLRGEILKIEQILNINIEEDYCYIVFKEYASGNGFRISEVNEWKHSKNIIDLIEVGDYVNGYNVLEKEGLVLSDGRYAFTVFKREGHNFVKIWREKDIKSIVTKEQFEMLEYKVGN